MTTQTKTAHTAGPWKWTCIKGGFTDRYTVSAEGKGAILSVSPFGMTVEDAAGMLEALELAQAAISEELAAGGDDEHPIFIKHRKALAKVTAAIQKARG